MPVDFSPFEMTALGLAFAFMLLVAAYALNGLRGTRLSSDERSRLAADGTAHQFIELSEGTVHYRLAGDEQAPLVVLIHGFSVPGFVWDEVIPPLLAAGYRVLAYDNYGRGFSDRLTGPYTADRSDRLLVELLDKLQIRQKVHLVGYSMGGATAAIFCARHAAQVASLSLIAPAGFRAGPPPFLLQLLVARPIGDWLVRVFGRTLFARSAVQGASEAADPDTFLEALNRQWTYRGYGAALLSTLRHYPLTAAQEEFAAAGRTGIPALIIWGEADRTVPFALAQQLLAALPAAKLHSYPGAGHGITYAQPREVARVITEFLAPIAFSRDTVKASSLSYIAARQPTGQTDKVSA